jgi:hypothetical protein
MQAVTRVNAEQASKKVMREPTHLNFGEGRRRWGSRAKEAPSDSAGVMATACIQGDSTQHGKSQRWWKGHQPATCEGQAGPNGMTERLVVPKKSI